MDVKIALSLSEDGVQYIVNVLQRCPLGEVLTLWTDIKQQCAAHDTAVMERLTPRPGEGVRPSATHTEAKQEPT